MALNLKNHKILVVDDVREMRLSLTTISKALGARTVYEAKSGEEALEQLQSHSIDIVLCDYNLGPGRDGQQVFEEAKEFGLIAPHASFIMITAEASIDLVMAVVEHSPDGYLIKPLNKSVLEMRLEKVLHRKRVFKEIEVQMVAGDYAKAAAICDVMIKGDPKLRLDLLRMKAEALFELGDADAVSEICAGVLMEREISWAMVLMGRANYLDGNFAKARSLFSKTIEQNSNLMEAYDWMVRIDREQGDFVKAQKIQEAAVLLSPKSIKRQQLLADLAKHNGDHEVACKAFQAAVDLGENSCFSRVDDQVGLVNAVAETGGPEAALKALDALNKPRKGRPPIKPDWRLDLSQGQLLLAGEKAVPAKEAIQRAYARYLEEPRDAADPASMALAKVCYALGMMSEAQKLMDRIVRENHDREDIISAAKEMFSGLGMEDLGSDLIENARREVVEINNRGVALAKEGKLGEAVELLTRASDELPGNLTVAINVLQVILSEAQTSGYTNQRQYTMSEFLKRAERIDGTNPKLIKLREKIARMRQDAA
ncbi:MAG: response regulator [Proteobacteria bacterium]|nr:MAG: response regulator [Pseudomonadota bacterium]